MIFLYFGKEYHAPPPPPPTTHSAPARRAGSFFGPIYRGKCLPPPPPYYALWPGTLPNPVHSARLAFFYFLKKKTKSLKFSKKTPKKTCFFWKSKNSGTQGSFFSFKPRFLLFLGHAESSGDFEFFNFANFWWLLRNFNIFEHFPPRPASGITIGSAEAGPSHRSWTPSTRILIFLKLAF